MNKPEDTKTRSLQTLQVLRQAVAKTLNKKKRLGHCAVVWQDGQVVVKGGDVEALDYASAMLEKRFLEQQLAGQQESAKLTKESIRTCLQALENRLAQLVAPALHG